MARSSFAAAAWLISACCVAWPLHVSAQPPAASLAPGGNAAREQKLAERGRLWVEAQRWRSQGQPAEAIATGEIMLAVERELDPRPHEDLALILDWLGQSELERENFSRADQRFQQSLDIRTALRGPGHWTVTDARRQLEQARLLAKLSPQGRQDLRDADRALSTAAALYGEGKYAAAIQPADQCRQIRLRVLGDGSSEYASAVAWLAAVYGNAGDYDRAEPLYRQVLKIEKQALGQGNPEYATSLNNLALLYQRMGDFGRAEPLFRQALEIWKNTLGETHPNYAACLHNMALLYQSMGDYARAEPLFRQALEILKKTLGEAHPNYATSLNSLALLYRNMGDYARAEPLYRQALEIRKNALGEAHPNYAGSLNNLAALYESMGDYARAEPLFRQALEIKRQALGEMHPQYAVSLNNLAALYERMGDYARAEPLDRQALEIRRKSLGETHPLYATSLNNLAQLYENTGDFARAEPLYRQALEIRRKSLGETHPLYAISLNNLAGLYQGMDDYARAEPLYHDATAMTLKALEQSFLGESERQQLAHAASVRFQFDSYLALEARHGSDGGRVYPFWLQWKGLVLRQQMRQHALVDRPELKPEFAELEQVTARLARLALAVPTPDKRDAVRRQLADLSGHKERLERDLAHRSAEFAAAAHAATIAELQAALPAEAALLDFVEYWQRLAPEKPGGEPTWKRQLAAFVVRSAGPIQLVSLDESGPVTEAIDRWRGKTDSDFGRSSQAQAAGKRLRELVWQPVESRLAGAKLVLISPDGPLGRLPFNALPGKEAGHYLLEDWPLAVVPSPAALAQPAPKPSAPPDDSLLVVADVDYDHLPSAGAREPAVADASQIAQFDRGLARAASQDPWPALKGTLGELAMLEQLYREHRFDPRQIHTLSRAEATTAALRQAAGRYRYLHLATHGFFASQRFHSALEQQLDVSRRGPETSGDQLATSQSVSGYHPGLLSGLVLAGANHPRPGDNGYLTAEEVGTLDLRGVQLAVLSACETGLGSVAGGEGLLGLQRAFQAAGARTVVASLWRVPDRATQLLMERFYKNLWQQQPRMTKLEALREAQLWMLRTVPKHPRLMAEASRGLELEAAPADDELAGLAPRFWAAFVLSGDWR